jgi:hypothetical protein
MTPAITAPGRSATTAAAPGMVSAPALRRPSSPSRTGRATGRLAAIERWRSLTTGARSDQLSRGFIESAIAWLGLRPGGPGRYTRTTSAPASRSGSRWSRRDGSRRSTTGDGPQDSTPDCAARTTSGGTRWMGPTTRPPATGLPRPPDLHPKANRKRRPLGIPLSADRVGVASRDAQRSGA